MRIQLITSNEGKYREMGAELEKSGHQLTWARHPYPEIQTDSLEEVVKQGMQWLQGRLEMAIPFIIEDSGLFVEALKGFPGVYSAYVMKTLGNAGLLRLLAGEADRSARFESRIGFWSEDKGPHIFAGSCAGSIAATARGSTGFGFDPIFVPEGENRTFAEMTTQEKNLHSHRGRSSKELLKFLGRSK
jgi:XTP/dITP diphosphohydrolase